MITLASPLHCIGCGQDLIEAAKIARESKELFWEELYFQGRGGWRLMDPTK
jgi:hypothetical protein